MSFYFRTTFLFSIRYLMVRGVWSDLVAAAPGLRPATAACLRRSSHPVKFRRTRTLLIVFIYLFYIIIYLLTLTISITSLSKYHFHFFSIFIFFSISSFLFKPHLFLFKSNLFYSFSCYIYLARRSYIAASCFFLQLKTCSLCMHACFLLHLIFFLHIAIGSF